MRPTDPAAETVFRSITGPLLAWYAGNARILPWRMVHPDPYRTLISEIMLQQTRVETVKPYYEKFIHELPDIRALAEAEEAAAAAEIVAAGPESGEGAETAEPAAGDEAAEPEA